MSKQVSRGSAGEYQADERAGVARLSWRVSGRCAVRCGVAQLASIRQMSRQVSRGSDGEYQADERAGVARLSWRVSEQHLLKTFPEDKIAHQTRVTLPGITAQSLGRKSDDTDQSCLSSNSLKVSKNTTPILESLIMEFNQIALLTHTNNFKIQFFLGLLEGLTPPKAASCFSKLCNLCSHRSEVK